MTMGRTTYIDVTLKIDHDEALTDEQLHDAVSAELPGTTLVHPRGPGTPSAVIDDVPEVWVKGAA